MFYLMILHFCFNVIKCPLNKKKCYTVKIYSFIDIGGNVVGKRLAYWQARNRSPIPYFAFAFFFLKVIQYIFCSSSNINTHLFSFIWYKFHLLVTILHFLWNSIVQYWLSDNIFPFNANNIYIFFFNGAFGTDRFIFKQKLFNWHYISIFRDKIDL